MAETPAWHTRPIFITSTFRDMHAERDYLRTHVFLELEERLKARRTHLEPIDLRWGVETFTTEEEHAKEMLVLKVCLAEVERSRPFLIGLIGDRYGWIPPEERMAAAAEEVGFKQPLTGRSVTDLEINFGVLDSPEQKQRSFFYFRDPLPYDEMSPQLAAEYSDAHNPESKDAADKLIKLKQQIETALPDRVRHYRAKWDSTNHEVTGLEAWGQQVLKDLWQELDRETRAFVDLAEVTWQSQERFALEQFIENRALGFVGRKESLKQAIEFATSADPDQQTWGLGITGKPGTGKSALFSQLNRLLNDQDVLVLAHAAGISPSSTQVNQMLRRWIDELAQVLSIQDPIPEDARVDDIEEIFRSLLTQTSNQQRVVVLIDALNQFERINRAKHLTWLPKTWPDNTRLITTAIPGTETEALFEREGIKQLELPLLDETDARDIATHICDRYHRKLNPDVLELLLAKQTKDDQPSYGNPLWLNMAIEEINLLDADDFARAEQQFTGNPEEKLHQLIISTAKEMPCSVTRLYGWMLDRAEDLFGKPRAEAFVNLITIGRSGWREKDFESLIPTITNEPWSNLTFAALRRTFRSHITQKGIEAQWDFSHAQMRIAVEHRNLTQKEIVQALHQSLSDHLLSLQSDDALHETETMYHLYRADDRQGAALYYGVGLNDLETKGATQVLATEILIGENTVPNLELEWVCSLPKQEDLDSKIRWGLASKYLVSINFALKDISRLDTRKSIIQSAETVLLGLLEENDTDAAYQYSLCTSYNYMGDLLHSQGDLNGALSAFRASKDVFDKLVTQVSADPRVQDELSVCHHRIGQVLEDQGDLEGAILAFRNSMSISKQLVAHDPDNLDRLQSLAVYLCDTGRILTEYGDLESAQSDFLASIEISEQLVNQDPGNSFWQLGLSNAYEGIAEVMKAREDLNGALSAYQTYMAIHERLVARDPINSAWQLNLTLGLINIGKIQQALGDPNGALLAFRKSIETVERLIERDQNNYMWQHTLAMSHFYVGELLLDNNDLSGAKLGCQSFLKIIEQLAEQDPANTKWQLDLSVGNRLYGDVLRKQGDLHGASSLHRISLGIAEKLTLTNPNNKNWQNHLARCHTNIGTVLQAQGDLRGALASYREALKIDKGNTTHSPDNGEYQRNLSVCHENIGNVLQLQGEFDGALSAYREAIAIAGQLAELDLANTKYQSDLSICHNKLGDLLQVRNDLDGALKAYQASMTILKKLDVQQKGSTSAKEELISGHQRIGTILKKQGDLGGALEAFQAGMVITEQLVEKDMENTGLQYSLSISHGEIGEVLKAQGNLDGALEEYQTKASILDKLITVDPDNSILVENGAVSYKKIGDVLTAQEKYDAALSAYLVFSELTEELVSKAPDNSHLQTQLAISLYFLATTSLYIDDTEAANFFWARCHETLEYMKEANMPMTPKLGELLERLNASVVD